MSDGEGLFTEEELQRGYVSRKRFIEILKLLAPICTWRERGYDDARKVIVKAGNYYGNYRDYLLFSGNAVVNGEPEIDKWHFSAANYQTMLRLDSTTGKTHHLSGPEETIRIIKGEAKLWTK